MLYSLATNSRKIKYFGNSFFYDNYYTPLSIQVYPSEVNNILRNVCLDINKVLDIGGNIGQFSVTLKNLIPNSHIDVFEPNPDIFEMLTKNTSYYDNINVYNYGIGNPAANNRLNYVKGKSAIGSIFADNAKHNNKNLKTIGVNLVKDVKKITHSASYDLVKVDVEGFEYDVIKELSNVKTKLLFIEISGTSRYKNFDHSELFNLIENKFGKYDVVYITKFESSYNNFEILFSFK